jgi:carbamoyl-phosphate synthase large subunit
MKVLISSVGRRNYIVEYFQQALGNPDDVYVTNSLEACAGVYASRNSFLAPPIDSDDYIPFLVEQCRLLGIQLVLSLFDQDLLKLSRHKEIFTHYGITLAISDPDVIEGTFDKVQCAERLKQLGIVMPQFYELDEMSAVQFPLILKPRWGTGSIATQLVNSPEELEFFWNYCSRQLEASYLREVRSLFVSNSMLIQECVNGQEYHLDVINDLDGNYVTTFSKKKLAMRAGETDAATTLADSQLEALGARLGQGLRHRGLLDVDLIQTADGRYYVLDLNPRFGGGYPFSHAAGANIPACLIAWARQQTPDPNWLRVHPDVTAVKGIRIYRERSRLD